MPLAFLTPLFLGGIALIGVPWLIHQIRRPEREPLAFSSLMFIPKIDKKVIERRRIQHLLLLLVRMLLLLLLAFAFSRPYWKTPVAGGESNEPARHVIILDNSYSMGALGWFDDAKKEAQSIVRSLEPGERVGVITVARSPRVRAPLFAGEAAEAGRPAPAREAIETLQLTEESTAYLPALQLAQDMLTRGGEGGEEGPAPRMIVHLVSDFQTVGMPEQAFGWKLSPRIEFDPVEIGRSEVDNHAISDLGVRKSSNGEIRVQGKIKNWSESRERAVDVKFVVGGKEIETASIRVKPGNASQVSFTLPDGGEGTIEGRLELGPDELNLDNSRYFVWNPPRKKQVLLLADPVKGEPWTSAFFLSRAAPAGENSPWGVDETTQAKLTEALGRSGTLPDLILVTDLNGISLATAQTLLQYVREGGRVLMALGGRLDSESLNPSLLAPLGLKALGTRYREARQTRYDMISWVDFDHPIFVAFRGARYNDFSQIRFFNYHRIVPLAEQPPDVSHRVIAKLEGDEEGDAPAAMIEVDYGKGSLLILPFGFDLEWTTFAKNIKFVPVLLESMAHLTGVDEDRRTWFVGESYTGLPKPSGEGGRWEVQYPQGDLKSVLVADLRAAADPPLRRAGFMRWRAEGREGFDQVDAVNINAAESDPARIPLQEFELKLTAAPILDADRPADPEWENVPDGYTVKREYWRGLLALLFAFLLFEGWYASRLIR